MFEAGGMINSSEALKSCTVLGINKACLGNTWPGESDFHSIYQFIIDRGTLHSRG